MITLSAYSQRSGPAVRIILLGLLALACFVSLGLAQEPGGSLSGSVD